MTIFWSKLLRRSCVIRPCVSVLVKVVMSIVCNFQIDIFVVVRLVTVASGAAAGRFLRYEPGGPAVAVQTAYGIEVEVRVQTIEYDEFLSNKVMRIA